MKVYQKLLENHNLSPNELYFIWCLISNNKPINLHLSTELRILESKGYIDEKGKLTPLGIQLGSELAVISSESKEKVINIDDANIEKYINYFPKIKLPSGKYARVDKKNLKSAFTWFFKNFDYGWEIVFKATARYVDEYETKGYLYMRNSQYFICKTNPDKSRDSELANYCFMLKNGLDKTGEEHFKEKVV